MGDPLSVAGSAVGIISLGIQVCQGLVQYADAVRGQQRDVDDGMDEVRSLLAVFKSLEQTIARIETDSPENAKSLLEHLRQAEAKLRSLEEVLKEVGIPVSTSSSIKGKMKETYRAAIYPMKKSKLEGARQSVQSLLGILTTALQTADLDLGISQADALKTLQSIINSSASELKAAVEANSTQLNSIQATSRRELSNISNSLVSTRAEVQAFSTRSANQLDSVGGDIRESLQNTQLLVGMIRDLSLQINTASANSGYTESHNQNGLLVATLSSQVPPSSLKQACDLYAIDTNLIPKSSRSITELPQPRRRRKYCRCPPRPKRRDDHLSKLIRGAYFEQTTVSEHDVGCPFAKFARQSSTTKAGVRFRLQLRGLFSTLVDVSMCLTTGAGGFSLSPSLRCAHVRTGRSAVFWLIWDCFHPKPISDASGQQESMVDRIWHMRRQIIMCFEQGTASPHDISEFGNRNAWMWLLNCVFEFFAAIEYEEEAFRLAIDTMRWLIDASALEIDNYHAEAYIYKVFCWWEASTIHDETGAVARDFFRGFLDIVEPCDETLIPVLLQLNPSLNYVLPLLRTYIPYASPMAWAILSRSMPDLEYQLKIAPASVFERTCGYTTLQLASIWLQGFERLIQTDARTLIHEPMPDKEGLLALGYDLFYEHLLPHPSALSTLLDAGYTLFPGNQYKKLGGLLCRSTDESTHVIAKYLAKRLRWLSELAANFGILPKDDTSIPDFETAARWCLALEKLGESIDPSIRVPMSDDMVTTIYHFRDIPLRVFPIFYEHGFIHINTCDQWGLPPLFAKRYHFLESGIPSLLPQHAIDDRILEFHCIGWLWQHGFLSQKPRDPRRLGLNVDATGAHRIAAEMGPGFFLELCNQQDMDNVLEVAADLLWRFARDSQRDKCVCWCNSDGDGCSPLKLLYKSHAHREMFKKQIIVESMFKFQSASITRIMFNFEIFENPTTPGTGVRGSGERQQATSTQPSTRALELVRLLTFEALEMTHTCCMLEGLGEIGFLYKGIRNCNPSTVRDIQESEEEKRIAKLLDSLMEEFCNVMQQDYRAKSLHDFIFGYWETRIKGLYAVREDEIQKMQQHVDNVRTGIWPVPLVRLLWLRVWGYWKDEDPMSVHEETDSDED